MSEMTILRNVTLINNIYIKKKKGEQKEIIIEYLSHLKMTTTNLTVNSKDRHRELLHFQKEI